VKSARFIILFPLLSVVVVSLAVTGGVWRTAAWVIAAVSVVAAAGVWICKRPAR